MINFKLEFTTSKVLAFLMFLAWALISVLLVVKEAYVQIVPFAAIMIPTIGAIASIKNITDKK